MKEDGDDVAGIRHGSSQRESMALIIATVMITIIDGVLVGLDKDGNHLVGTAEVIERADFACPAAQIAVALG